MGWRHLRAVLFDLDGTLCRYTVTVAAAMAGALRALELDEDLLGDLEDAAARYDTLWREYEGAPEAMGKVRVSVWERLVGERRGVDPACAGPLAEAYAAIRMPSVKLYPGARELLIALQSRYRLGLLTNGPTELQWPKIRGTGIEELFDAIVVAGDIGIYKPDPRAFAALLDSLAIAPEEAVYIGDSPTMDVAGARGAALHTVWISRDGLVPNPSAPPDHTIAELEELRGMLL
jgi:HAD superfamily hydrolase (TIGR01509 family)